ncbi:MAG: hypothetical protein Q9N34_08350, partial [Aquificota bacterium]|nr:hypothetical protein [Aquificota bacterium]
VVFVDRGRGRVVLLTGGDQVDSFEFKRVHGGVKFTDEGFYVPSRDGWVLYYSLKEKRPRVKLRPCVYLRNLAVNGDRVAVSCVLPQVLVITGRSFKTPQGGPPARETLRGLPLQERLYPDLQGHT